MKEYILKNRDEEIIRFQVNSFINEKNFAADKGNKNFRKK